MTLAPYVRDPDFTLYHGDVRQVLPQLEAGSVDCALTSPPFYGLRDYGMDGQIGLEASPDEWAAELVAVFAEVRRVLKPSGTLWVECGDSYCANQGVNYGTSKAITGTGKGGGRADDPDTPRPTAWGGGSTTPMRHPTKPKDLLGQPWLLAFALRADGWYLRQAIVWHKPNAMPESAKDRCTTAHSYVFLLAKSPRYHFDSEAIAEPAEWARWGDQTTPKYEGTATSTGWMQPKTKAELRSLDAFGRKRGADARDGRADPKGDRPQVTIDTTKKHPRSVWTIPTQGFPEAHFATWPEALVERIVKAGCPEGGTVLDPFMGSGTTALVARRLGRNAVGVELNAEYAAMCARRLGQQSLLAEGAA